VPEIPDSHRDLLTPPHVAALSTIGSDGLPQVTAIWVLLDGDTIRTSVLTSRQKYKNLVANPNATLFVVDPANPYRTLEVRAHATLDDDGELEFFERIVRHYGQDPDTFGAPRDGRVLLTLHPVRVVTNG
jgi:PPOX class probable F420-dependent enzyme